MVLQKKTSFNKVFVVEVKAIELLAVQSECNQIRKQLPDGR